MLDTYGRRIVEPIIQIGVNIAIKLKLSANKVTILAMIIGILSSIFYLYDFNKISVITLWLSGYLDAVDGGVARKEHKISKFGTVMDITFDRIVESGIIIVTALKFPETKFYLLILLVVIMISMTIFLTTGLLIENNTRKSFYYQSGLAERTEGFIMLMLIILCKGNIKIILLFIFIIVITILQRFIEAKKKL